MRAICARAQVVELLLRAGASVAMLDDDGQTALHHAAHNGHALAVQALAPTSVCAEVFVCDKYQMTPFHLACENGHDLVVAHLLALCDEVERSATPNSARAGQIRRGSAIFLAQKNGHDKVVNLVQVGGAPISRRAGGGSGAGDGASCGGGSS